MIQFAEVRIDGERRFAFHEDGDGVIVNAGFVRLDEAEHWATWDQFEADYETSVAIYELSMATSDAYAALGDLASYRRLCPDWVS
jgi:hypothetical protein